MKVNEMFEIEISRAGTRAISFATATRIQLYLVRHSDKNMFSTRYIHEPMEGTPEQDVGHHCKKVRERVMIQILNL